MKIPANVPTVEEAELICKLTEALSKLETLTRPLPDTEGLLRKGLGNLVFAIDRR